MDFKDYSLTKENLAYLGLFEPFYDLYCSYKDILLDAQEELSTQKRQTVWPDEITKFANNKSRLLFNDFLTDIHTCLLMRNTFFMQIQFS